MSTAKVFCFITLSVAVLALCPAFSQAAALPEGDAGLAAKYPGDAGIEKDPNVVFVESFEHESPATLKDRWQSVKNLELMSFSDDRPVGSSGNQSLRIRHIGGESTGAHLYRQLLPGYDQLFLRFYVKFDRDCNPIHHFVHMGGYNPSTPWPQGGAGDRPAGNERLTTGAEPFGARWRWDFYSYWMEMHGDPNSNFWGNDFINDDDLAVPRDRWICVELMMKMNDPVSGSNGEQALWINGRLWRENGQITSHLRPGAPNGEWIWDSWLPDPDGEPFGGFRWRNTTDLNLNFLWLLLYITKAPDGHESLVWFDNVVVAREYIGPLAPAKTAVSPERSMLSAE